MKKLIICLMVGLMMFTLVSASDDDYMGKQFMNVPIIETCGDVGAACDDTYECNITVTDPNQDVIILNLPMTRNDTIYNFTIVDTDVLGIYKIKTFCGNGTFSGESIDGRLEITTTGSTANTLVINLFLILGALILLLIGISIKSYPIGFLSGILFLISGIYMTIYGFGNFADMYTRAIGITIIGLGGLFVLSAGYEWLKSIDD